MATNQILYKKGKGRRDEQESELTAEDYITI